MVALYIISFACLIAIFAYPLAPDNSPNANRMIPELSSKPPGFTKRFLLQLLPQHAARKSALESLFTGTAPTNSLLPINSYYFTRDSIIVEHYIDKGRMHTMGYPLRNLVPARLRRPADQQPYVVSYRIQQHTFLLGTDKYGRDILSRLVLGTRVSLVVGFIAALIALSIGLIIGTIAGYYDGWLDKVVLYLTNVLRSIPTILLVFSLSLIMGRGFWPVLLAIGLAMSVGTTRLIRTQVRLVREQNYILAAKILGLSDLRILFRHILPNISHRLAAIGASSFAATILMEAGLSFLGIGIQAPIPSWGLMVREHINMFANQPILVFIACIAVFILALSFNILANTMQDALDVPDLRDVERATQ